MSKVQLKVVYEALEILMDEYTDKFNHGVNQFLAGAKWYEMRKEVQAWIASKSDGDGFIDIEDLRGMATEGMRKCKKDGKGFIFPFQFLNLPAENIRISKEDFDRFFDTTLKVAEKKLENGNAC